MATFTPIAGASYGLRTDLATKKHNLNASDTITACLATAIPGSTTYVANTTDLPNANGYGTAGLTLSSPVATETGGTLTFATATTAKVWTASGAGLTFQYVLIVNATANLVLGYYNYGSSLTVPSGSTFTFTPGASHFTLA